MKSLVGQIINDHLAPYMNRWELAFIDEKVEDVVGGRPIHITKIHNPYFKEYWFADPFILDVDDNNVYVLAEAMPLKQLHKGEIALLTISMEMNAINRVEIVLAEPWHLSFPNIMRKDGKIYVYPESLNSGKLYRYELIKDNQGNHALKRVDVLCNAIVWDSEISDVFGEEILFTCKQDDFHLDIYRWDKRQGVFLYSESIDSEQQNMRMAGSLFKVGDKIYCPSQISTPTIYGKAVEIKELSYADGKWQYAPIRRIDHPQEYLLTGLHTFNTYKGVTIIDFHYHNYTYEKIVSKLVAIKRWIKGKE